MIPIEFDEYEIDLMREILDAYLHELSFEISSTDKLPFRQDLKEKKVHVAD
ncbi:MAG: hypothetical protein P8182_09890 [Deltaproteobacteria bacterium]